MADAHIDPKLLALSASMQSMHQNKCKATKLADEISAMPKRGKPNTPIPPQVSPLTIMYLLTYSSSIRVLQAEFDKAKYELVGHKLVCLGHPFTSPQVALSIGLKHYSGRGAEIDMYNYIKEVIVNVLTQLIQQGQWGELLVHETILTHTLGLEEALETMEVKELKEICGWVSLYMHICYSN